MASPASISALPVSTAPIGSAFFTSAIRLFGHKSSQSLKTCATISFENPMQTISRHPCDWKLLDHNMPSYRTIWALTSPACNFAVQVSPTLLVFQTLRAVKQDLQCPWRRSRSQPFWRNLKRTPSWNTNRAPSKVAIPLDSPFLHTILTLIKRPALMFVYM